MLWQLLKTQLHQTKAIYLFGRSIFVLFEELEECCGFLRIKTPPLLDNEPGNAKTKAINVGYLSSLRNPSACTIQRLISRGIGIRDAASS